MKFATQSTQSPGVTNPAASPGNTFPGLEATPAALVQAAEETVRLALGSAVDVRANRVDGQDAATETATPFTGRAGNRAGTAPVFSFPPRLPNPPRATLHALQEWEGYIVEMESNEFVARLVDLTAGSTHEEEEAVIPLQELSD